MGDYSDQRDLEEEEMDAIRLETGQRATALNLASRSLDTAELTIVCFGLAANLIGSITLFISQHMSTPSFIYHKALGLANLAYCMNFILVKTLRQYASEGQIEYSSCFPNYLTAYYMGVVSRAVTSTCGYFVMYMSLLIIADRFLALILLAKYYKFNKLTVARRLVLASLTLSASVHSWAPWAENEVKSVQIPTPEGANSNSNDQSNSSVLTFYAVLHREEDQILTTAVALKDIYNLVTRLTYAIAQSALTVCVIRAFQIQSRKRLTLIISSSMNPRARRGSGNGSNNGSERSLSYLMLTVAFLSCIQVLPREFKRVFDFIYPLDVILPSINDRSLPIDIRRRYILLAVYGHGYWKLIANVLTAIERSALFYLYFILNPHFRVEVVAPLTKLRAWLKGRGAAEVSPLLHSTSLVSRSSTKTNVNTIISKSSVHVMGAMRSRRLNRTLALFYAPDSNMSVCGEDPVAL